MPYLVAGPVPMKRRGVLPWMFTVNGILSRPQPVGDERAIG